MVWLLAFFTLAGYNFTFWFFIGIVRFIWEKLHKSTKRKRGRPIKEINKQDVAAIIPAHNEQDSIQHTILALVKVLPKKNIYVASDHSTDNTVSKARLLGVNVYDIRPNQGKARAIVATLGRYKLIKRYKAILINDADVTIDKNYIKRALPLFKDRSIVVVAPHGVTRWKKYELLETFFIAYRIRLWRIIQLGMRFGQTWKFTNVSYIVPGSLCLYRTKVLKKINIATPGLIIEDFNMTFELHKKRLGKIAYRPNIFGIHQDPYNLKDYLGQVKRWNLGFWQTVRRNGIWPSFFCISTYSFVFELVLYASFILSVPFLFVWFIINSFQPINLPFISSSLTFSDLLIGLFAMDYVTTVIAAILERKPILMLYGLGFFFLRYIDAFLYIFTIPLAFKVSSSGTWVSPKRK